MATAELPRDDLLKMIRTLQTRIATLEQRSPFAGTGISPTDPGGTPGLTLTDSTGGLLLAEDAGGSGAAWPLAPIPFAGLSWPTWDSNNTTTYAVVSAGHTVKSSPLVVVTAQAITDGSAVGWVVLRCNGVQVGTTVAVPNLSMIVTTFGPVTVSGNIGDPLDFTLETRLQGGTGKCYARVTSARFAASA